MSEMMMIHTSTFIIVWSIYSNKNFNLKNRNHYVTTSNDEEEKIFLEAVIVSSIVMGFIKVKLQCICSDDKS